MVILLLLYNAQWPFALPALAKAICACCFVEKYYITSNHDMQALFYYFHKVLQNQQKINKIDCAVPAGHAHEQIIEQMLNS